MTSDEIGESLLHLPSLLVNEVLKRQYEKIEADMWAALLGPGNPDRMFVAHHLEDHSKQVMMWSRTHDGYPAIPLGPRRGIGG